jgi:hypothetical protein
MIRNETINGLYHDMRNVIAELRAEKNHTELKRLHEKAKNLLWAAEYLKQEQLKEQNEIKK